MRCVCIDQAQKVMGFQQVLNLFKKMFQSCLKLHAEHPSNQFENPAALSQPNDYFFVIRTILKIHSKSAGSIELKKPDCQPKIAADRDFFLYLGNP
jgi:hypothetical protein